MVLRYKTHSSYVIIVIMKLMNNLLNDSKQIVFIDFEGTQLTQEIIAIGAIKVDLDNKHRIKKAYKPFKVFIRAEGVVGPIVTELTGITDIFLFQHGLTFKEALEKFEAYCGKNLTFVKFMTYGNFDMRLLHQTALQNSLEDDDFIHAIYKKYIDFANVISRFVRSNRNETLSLFDALRKFEITPQGNAHDPESDAINLSLLYNAFLTEKNIVREEYQKVLLNNPKLPRPIQRAISELVLNGQINMEQFEHFIDEDLK